MEQKTIKTTISEPTTQNEMRRYFEFGKIIEKKGDG